MFKTRTFYAMRCKIINNGIMRTIAYKIGVTDSSPKDRDIKGEWKSCTAGSKTTSGWELICDEASVEEAMVLEGEAQFINNLENFCKDSLFRDDIPMFVKKTEYFQSYEDTVRKFDYLVSVLKDNLSNIQEHRPNLTVINDCEAKGIQSDSLVATESKFWNTTYNDIASKISKEFGLSKNNAHSFSFDQKPTNKTDLKDLESSIENDFYLFHSNKEQKLYLVHKKYHLNKSPRAFGGAFTISAIPDPKNIIKKCKFQFYNDFCKEYGYKPITQISISKISKLIKNSPSYLLDLDTMSSTDLKNLGLSD